MATQSAVAQARAKGGKPSDANRIAGRTAAMDVYDDPKSSGQATASDGSIVERGPNGEVYRYNPKYDHTTVEQNGNISAPMKGNQLPGSMNKYMDKVLEMSGMNAPAASAAPANVPVPTARPDSGSPMDDMNAYTPDAAPAGGEPTTAAQPSDSASIGEAILGLLTGGALGGAAKYAYDKVRGAGAQQSPVDQMIDEVDTPEQRAIEGPADREALPAPMKQITGPEAVPVEAAPQQALPAPTSAIDQQIDAIDGQQSALPAPPPQQAIADQRTSDTRAQNAVEGATNAATAPTSRAELLQQAMQMKPRDAVNFLRQNGIDQHNLTPDEIRILAEGSNALKEGRRAAAAARVMEGPVADAVRGAVRGAAR